MDPLFSDKFTCPECRRVLERPVTVRGVAWRALVEDHIAECRADSPLRLDRKVQAAPDRELRAFVFARLTDVSTGSRHAREVLAEHGPDSFVFESVVVRLMSDLMEIEKRILEARGG